MVKIILGFLLIFMSGSAFSATEASISSKVKEIYSYSEYGGGDVIVKLESNSVNCSDGYWLKKIDPGFQVNVSMLIAAYQANNQLVLKGHTDQMWPGSSGKFCHVYSVNYM